MRFLCLPSLLEDAGSESTGRTVVDSSALLVSEMAGAGNSNLHEELCNYTSDILAALIL